MFYQCCYCSHYTLVFSFQKTRVSAHSVNSQRLLACLWIVFSEQRFSLGIIFLDCFDAPFFFFPVPPVELKKGSNWYYTGDSFLKSVLYKTRSVQCSSSVVSTSLRPHGLQHARPPCPSPTPGACSNSRPSSRWCHPAISIISYSVCGLLVLLLVEAHCWTFWCVMNYVIISIGLLVRCYLWQRQEAKKEQKVLITYMLHITYI